MAHGDLRKRVMKQRALDAKRRIINHSIWRSGTAISEAGCGLKSSCVNIAESNEAITAIMNNTFKYDPTPITTPAMSPRPELVCSLALAGMCSKEDLWEDARNACVNLYGALKRHRIDLLSLPRHLNVSVEGLRPSLPLLLAFPFGRGDFYGVLRVKELEVEAGAVGEEAIFVLEYKDAVEGAMAITAPMHRLLRMFLCRARVEKGSNVDTLSCKLSKMTDVPEQQEFAYRLSETVNFDLDTTSIHPAPRVKPTKVTEEEWLPFGMVPPVIDHAAIPTKPDDMIASDANSSDVDPEHVDHMDVHRDIADYVSSESGADGDSDDDGKEKDDEHKEDEDEMLAPVRAVNEPGLAHYGKAPSSRTSCFLCKDRILTDEWRLIYRRKAGTAFRDMMNME